MDNLKKFINNERLKSNDLFKKRYNNLELIFEAKNYLSYKGYDTKKKNMIFLRCISNSN